MVSVLVVAAIGCGGNNNPQHSDAAIVVDTAPPDAPPPGSSFDTAIDITSLEDSPGYAGTLTSITTRDYFKITLAAGERLVAGTSTNAGTVTDGSVTDTVVTLYDPAQTAIARNDDSWPRFSSDSSLWFEAPAAGTYYVTVEDCRSAFGANGCPPTTVTDLRYHLFANHPVHTLIRETHAASTQDGTIAHAQTIAYSVPSGGTAGNYGYYMLDGNFTGTTDTHVYGFVPPAAMLQTGTRERVELWVKPTGPTGSSSTANIKIWVTAADGTTILAQADQNNYGDGRMAPKTQLDLSLPVTAGTQYYVFVQNTAASSAPATDFYYVEHYVGSWFVHVAELEGATNTGANDTMATAEVLTSPARIPGGYYVDGNIATATDVDWFEVDPPSADNTAFVACYGARQGSGIVGLTATLYDATGATALGNIAAETTGVDSYNRIAIPSGTAKAYLKVSASSLDSIDTGTHYRCYVYYYVM
jgi:hypothetical protein